MIIEFIFGIKNKDEALNLLRNSDLTEKFYIILSHIKISKRIIRLGDIEIKKIRSYKDSIF